MIRLKSYGDKLTSGVYRLHSRFERAANFVCGDSLVCCVDESIGPGPFNVVLAGTPVDTVQSLMIDTKSLLINGKQFDFEPSRRYRSSIKLSANIDKERLADNIRYFGDCLKRLSNPYSLAFLLDSRRENKFFSAFGIEFICRCKAGVEYFFTGDFIKGVERLRGLGFGLTPSGDDFLAGAMAALNLSQSIFRKDNSGKIAQIYQAARGENPLVNAFLECAKDGYLAWRFNDLIEAILYDVQPWVYLKTQDLLEMGETSGADWGTGFYMTMWKEIYSAGD
jgi:hypothetical protein